MRKLHPAVLIGLMVASLGAPLQSLKAADLGVTPRYLYAPPPRPWTWHVTTYAWFTWLDGDVTVRNRDFEVEASLGDVLDALEFAYNGTIEARRGPWSFWGDLVYADLSSSGEIVATRPDSTLGATVASELRMTTVEAAAAYEVASAPGVLLWWPGNVYFDVYAGARYWNQRAEIEVNASGTANLSGLDVSGSRAIARSGSVDWVDPFIGMRLRRDLPGGGEAFLRADVGGFGAGSNFSWQLFGAVNWHLCDHYAIAWDAFAGYRALSVDYEKGSGQNHYEYDVTTHGPVVGLTGRF